MVENVALYRTFIRFVAMLLFGAMGVGETMAFAPDYAKARTSAAKLFTLFDRVPPIDVASNDGKTIVSLIILRIISIDCCGCDCERRITTLKEVSFGEIKNIINVDINKNVCIYHILTTRHISINISAFFLSI